MRTPALVPVLLAILTLGALTACDTLFPPGDPAPAPDSITITITGLPDELAPDVTLTGPDEYKLELTETVTLEELAAGEYTLTAATVAFNGNELDPDQTERRLRLEPGGTISAGVAYAPHRELSIAVIAHLNEYRAAAGLPLLPLDADNSLPNWLHARYLGENRLATHEEDPTLKWYTPEGEEAGRRSNLAFAYRDMRDDPHWPVTVLAQAPFHFADLLSPGATAARFALYTVEGECPDTLDCGDRAQDWTVMALEAVGAFNPWPEKRVVRFPEDQQTVSVLEHFGEWPSPLTACPGYSSPAGLPLLVMHGRGAHPNVASSRLTLNGAPVDHCIFTAATYTNPDPELQRLVASVLTSFGAVVIVPRDPLTPDSTYHVDLQYEDSSDSWQFHTAASLGATQSGDIVQQTGRR